MTPAAPTRAATPGKTRIDKWLWHARFFRSRRQAGEVVASGAVRVNGERIAKPAHVVRVGDVLTFPQAGRIRVVRILGLAARRGPAAEAQTLYGDLDPTGPPPEPSERGHAVPVQHESAGRPSKRERREIVALRRRDP